MPDEGQADVAVEEQRTDELASGNAEPTTEVEGGAEDAGNTSLNFDELLPKKDPNNKRGGLSRKEARLAKAQDDINEVEPDKLDILLNEVNELKSQLASQSSRKSAEAEFNQALAEAGVDVATFNAQFKDDYLNELNSLIDDGIDPEKASKLARKMVLPKVKAKDAENRSSGRIRSTLPPTSQPQKRTVYKESEVMKLLSKDRAEYKRLMNARDRGEIEIV